MIRRAPIVTIGLLIGGSFYLLLIDTTSLPELYVLAGVALACGLAFRVSREQGFAEARVALRMLAGVWRLAVKIPLDIALVMLGGARAAGTPARLARSLPGRAFRRPERRAEASRLAVH